MTIFTWATAVSGSWTSPTFWTATGTGSYPGANGGVVDSADIAAPGTVTLQALTSPDLVGLIIGDPDAVLQIDGGLAIEVTIQNAGTIALGADAAVTAGNLGEPTLGLYANTGVISLGSGATYTIFAPCTTAAIGDVQFNGGTLVLGNPLDNTNAVIAASAFGNLDIGGEVTGGTIVNDGGNMQIAQRTPQGDGFPAAVTFTDVAFQGVLAPDGPLAISGGLMLTPLTPAPLGSVGRNTIDLTGSTSVPGTLLPDLHGQIVALDAMTIDNADVLLGDLQAETTITLGPDVAMTNAGMGFLGGAGSFLSNATITNTGTLAINNAGLFLNAGVLNNLGGTITDDNGGTLANDGTIVLSGGEFVAPVTGPGTLQLGNGATAELTAGYGQLSFQFLDATGVLRLHLPGGSNLVQGFAPGDRIELLGTPATVSYAAGTLTVANGTVTVASFLMPGQPADVQFSATTDSSFNTVITESHACFAAGTRIATPAGATAVEALHPGDRVRLANGGTAPVLWIGHRHVACGRHRRPWDVLPVRVLAGAFAPGMPSRDLWLSPDHAVFTDAVLIPIRYLINGRTIVQELVADVTYFHLELPAHAVILAEDLPCESYLDTGNRPTFANATATLRPATLRKCSA